MPTPLPDTFATFSRLAFLCLDDQGRFLRLAKGASDLTGATPVPPADLPQFLSENIYLAPGATDVFVWVHGWQNSFARALSTARRLFGNLDAAIQRMPQPGIKPAFVAVHWPSESSALPAGYQTIRDRAARMTEEGDAEFCLASLLGYLDAKHPRAEARGRLLRAAGGYYVHALGHSFGTRFLTAAIGAAAKPRSRTLSLLGTVPPAARRTLSIRTEKLFEFTVDTACFLQMAAPSAGFSDELSTLVEWSPFRGPLALTYSEHDRANCLWHKIAEGERAIGCEGAKAPANWIERIVLRPPDEPYTEADFVPRIVNIDASAVYTRSGLSPEGAHSDFWYDETIHLILSLALQARTRTAGN